MSTQTTRRVAEELPETVQIAQLLAELMPEPVDSAKEPVGSTDFRVQLTRDQNELAPSFDDLPPIPSPPPPPFLSKTIHATFPQKKAPTQPAEPAAEANVVPATTPPLPVAETIEAAPAELEVKLPPLSEEKISNAAPKRQLAAETNSDFVLESVSPAEIPAARRTEDRPIEPAAVLTAKSSLVSVEGRIPLGDLTLAAFFSLVNWHNDPSAVRHPPPVPRFDAKTTEELRKIPFIVLDAEPTEDEWSVAAVLKSFRW